MRRSLFQQHRDKWEGCERCGLHEHRNLMVFYRGAIPCDILFVGQGPGKSENVSGLAFDGPAGQLLDKIVMTAFGAEPVKWAFTNLVACLPWSDEKNKDRDPTPPEIRACRPRLEEFLKIAKPRMVVAVGTLAKNHLPTLTDDILRVDIVHPSHILQLPAIERPSPINRCIVRLEDAVQQLQGGATCSS